MRYSIILSIIGLLLLGAACKKPSTLNSVNTSQASVNISPADTSVANVNATPNTNVAVPPGRYVDYSDSVIANTSGTKILFFHAPWCPQCRKLEQSITSGPIPTNVTIIKVDYDSMQSLRQQYGVTLQTTVVLVNDAGQLVKKFNAYDDPSLSRIVQELL